VTSPSPPAPLPPGERGETAASANRVGDAIRSGLQESLRGGVTLLGDIATTGWSWEDYRDGPDSVVFQELLGLTPERIAVGLASAQRHAIHVDAGLSPHAPYSVHPDLFRHAVRLAKESNIPLAMHLAETGSERELLEHGTGEFRMLLEEFGIWRPALFGNRRWSEFLEPLSDLSHALVIHGNSLGDGDLRFLAQNPQMTLVYCPRTHAAFGHPPHPWQTLLELGGSVALGTDSRASNPDLSLWAELQYLAEKFPEMSHLELLRLATLCGARALARNRDHGSLETGKLANLLVVGPVPDDGPLLHQALITAASQITRIMQRGRWISP
jgi:cytosine/adenosine deaminase-related metal-dependent hydrolase